MTDTISICVLFKGQGRFLEDQARLFRAPPFRGKYVGTTGTPHHGKCVDSGSMKHACALLGRSMPRPWDDSHASLAPNRCDPRQNMAEVCPAFHVWAAQRFSCQRSLPNPTGRPRACAIRAPCKFEQVGIPLCNKRPTMCLQLAGRGLDTPPKMSERRAATLGHMADARTCEDHNASSRDATKGSIAPPCRPQDCDTLLPKELSELNRQSGGLHTCTPCVI